MTGKIVARSRVPAFVRERLKMTVDRSGWNYLILQVSDGFDFMSKGFAAHTSVDQSDTFIIINKQDGETAVELGYSAGGAYPAFILTHCPNAPNATYDQIRDLLRTKGSSGAAWFSTEPVI